MLRVALALAAGILLGEYCPALPLWSVFVAIGLGSVALAWCAQRRGAGFPFFAALWLTLAMLGCLVVTLRRPVDPFAGRSELGYMDLRVRLTDSPAPSAKTCRAVAAIDSANGVPAAGKVMLYVAKDSAAQRLRYGDRLCVRVRLRQPGDDGYGDYLRRRGIFWQGYVPAECWQWVGNDAQGLAAWSKRMQQRLVRRIRACDLTAEEQGVAEALVLGWRGDMDKATRQRYADAGIAHLLCVSGLHVGLFAMMVGGCLFFLGGRRWQRVAKGAVQMAAIAVFVLVSGMASSTMRAGLMFGLLLVGGMLERRPNGANNLATSAVVLLLVRPMLLFDMGFQLSYAAVAGIGVWRDALYRLVPRPADGVLRWYRVPLDWLWKWVCLSVAAQLGTLPLVLYYFHEVPVFFLLANVAIVPFAGVLLGSVLLMLLDGGMASLVGAELKAIDCVARWVGQLPGAQISDIYCDLPIAVLLGAALLASGLLIGYVQRLKAIGAQG